MKKRLFLVLLIFFSFTIHTFSQSKKEKAIENTFNFQEPFHTLGFSFFSGINFAPKLKDFSGEIELKLFSAFVPELILQYNFTILNGFGFSLELPFGIFSRKSYTELSNFGASNDVLLEMKAFYIGFAAKLTVFKELSKNICMQGELGLKFNPFYRPADQWYHQDYYSITEWFYYEDNSSINFPLVEQKYYAIPDATAGLLFFFHNHKNKKNNFLVGININFSFVKRIKVEYDTSYSELGLYKIPYGGLGSYGWDSTAIGISIGYRFFGVK